MSKNRMCTCMCNWVTMLYSRKKLYWEITIKIFLKYHIITSIDAEKAFGQIQHLFMKEIFNNIPQHNESHIRQTYSQHHTQH